MNPIKTSTEIALSVNVSEGRPRVKARNGVWVDGKNIELVVELRAALPGNIRIDSGYASTFVKFKRDAADASTSWRLENRQAYEFQAWVTAFGMEAVEMIRAQLEELKLLSLYRLAVDGYKNKP